MNKLFSGKFWMAITACISIGTLTGTVCAIIYNNPTADLNDSVAIILGALLGILGTITTSYFKKKDD